MNTIFLIDDDPVVNFVNKKIIGLAGCTAQVEDFVDANEALAEITQRMETNVAVLPCIIFLDIDMPLMNGWQFLDSLKQLPPAFLQNCKVFIVSALMHPGDITKSETYGIVSGYIFKPLSVGRFKIACSVQNGAAIFDK